MKHSLQLKVSQSLTMTPQLQQAIRLLQLSTLDLQHEIQEALDSNPMLELDEEQASSDDSQDSNKESDFNQRESLSEQLSDTSNQLEHDTLPDELPVDSQWEDVYQPSSSNLSAPASDDFDFDSRNTAEESLHDHLLWQLNLTPMSETDKEIALAIIDSIEPNGLLGTTLEDILEGFDESLDIEMDEVEAVLHRIHHFDPPGVAGRNLAECLTIQLMLLPEDTPWRQEAGVVLEQHIQLLGSKDYKQLMRKMKLREPQLKEVLTLIQSLNPNPGESISAEATEYIVPDVFVSKKNGRWTVEINGDASPRIRINEAYASMIKRADNSDDNHFLKDNLQEARWFLKSLQSRNETLMKVATKIVEHQRGFLEYGEEAMKPLILHDIADAVEMHESTISRVTTRKYMHTPRGIFELKYFFSSHVSTDTGGECSSTAIRALIKKLIAAEDSKKPLSDSKITTLLAEQGIKVARRTIAKYRESMNIPPSNERKQLI